MPKDSHMLPPWSQALLRAARMGQVQRPPAAPVEEDKEPGEEEDAEGDMEAGFLATKWGLVPSHLEGKETKFLADRRNGLAPLNGVTLGAAVGPGQSRRLKLRKTDNSGKMTVFEVIVPHGQIVEGEIVEESITLSEPPAPGTIVEGVGVVNSEGLVVAGDQIKPTPPRRRPPPPRRRPKGPGRGRKKKVAFAPGLEGSSTLLGVGVATSDASALEGELRSEGDGDQSTVGGDVEMGEGSVLQDGSEGSEEDDEGEDGEDGDREEGELSPTPVSSKSPSREPTRLEPTNDSGPPRSDIVMSSTATERESSSSPDLPLAANQSLPAIQPQFDSESTPINAVQSRMEPPEIHVNAPTMELGSNSEMTTDTFQEISQVPMTSQIEIEDLPEAIPINTEAELPPGHNPHDGLAEPKAPSTETFLTNEAIQFPEMEEDLLGSLERHLDKQS